MTNILKYKNYIAKIEYSSEDQLLYGKVEGIQSCEELNLEPDKPFKGSFNIRISPDLHREAYFAAIKEGISLNKLTENAISAYLSKNYLMPNITIQIEVANPAKAVQYPVKTDNIYHLDFKNSAAQ